MNQKIAQHRHCRSCGKAFVGDDKILLRGMREGERADAAQEEAAAAHPLRHKHRHNDRRPGAIGAMMKVGVGGTFNVLHRGHRRLLETAIANGNVLAVGLMSDDYCRRHKTVVLAVRREGEGTARVPGSEGSDFSIVPLNVKEGSAPSDPELDVLVVSQETQALGPKINDMRLRNGLRPVRIVVVPFVLAEDYRPISSTRVLGRRDRCGRTPASSSCRQRRLREPGKGRGRTRGAPEVPSPADRERRPRP